MAANKWRERADIFTGSMVVPVGLVGRQTGTPAADSVIWAIRNTGTVTWYVRGIHLNATFDGTAAATTAIYKVGRFTTATPSGGTAITPILKRASYTLPTKDAREALAGLTTTSCVFDTGAYLLSNQRQVSASSRLDLNLDGGHGTQGPFEIAANSGLYIALGAAAVVGDCLTGSVEIDWA